MEEIKDLRTFLNKTQQEFAETLGISVDTIRKWEQGKSKPSRMAQEKLAKLVARVKKNGAKLKV